jgi:hypothetical protein
MTRLERHAKRETRQRTISLLVIIALILIFVVKAGIPFIINQSVSLSQAMGGNKQATTGQSADPSFNSVEINTIPEATNSAQIQLTGTAQNIDKVSIIINGDSVKDIDTSSQSQFSATVGDLKSGSNEVYAEGSVKGSAQKKQSQKYTIVLSTSAPTIDVSEPQDGMKTPRTEITVNGKVSGSGDLNLLVQGLPAVISNAGTFSQIVPLKEGENKIVVHVSDQAGNVTEKTITVTYEK